MGVLDDIVGGLIGGGLGFLTGGPVGAVAGIAVGSGLVDLPGQPAGQTALPLSNTSITAASKQTVSIPVQNAPGILSQIGSAIGGGVASIVGQAVAPTATAAVLAGGAACPTTKNRVQTIIQTIAPNGKVIKQRIERGRPFLMNRDIVTAKRVFRTVAKVSGRLPRKTVKQSKASMLTDAALDKAFRDVQGDNGNGNGGKC